MKKTSKLEDGSASKLTLHRLTLRHLAAIDLDGVHGGVNAGKLPPPPSRTCPPDLPTK